MVKLAIAFLVTRPPHPTLPLRPPLLPLPTQPPPTALPPPHTSRTPSRLLLPTPRLSPRATRPPLPTTRPSQPITRPSLPPKRPSLPRTRPSLLAAPPPQPPTSTMLRRQRWHNVLVLPRSLRSPHPLGSSGTRDSTRSALSIVAVGSLLAILCYWRRCVTLPFLSYACGFFSPIRVMNSIVSLPHPRTLFFYFFPPLLSPSRNLCDHGLRLSFLRHGVPLLRGHFVSQHTPWIWFWFFSIVTSTRTCE